MTDVEVVNLALDQIGQPPLAALDNTTDVGKKCLRTYGPLRDAVLRDHAWNFAVKWKLALAADATKVSAAFAYSYTRDPKDLRVLGINDDPEAIWKVEGRHIVTDESSVDVQYIEQNTDPTTWDSGFVIMFSVRLAAHLALAISQRADYAQKLLQTYELLKTGVLSVDGQEGTLEPFITDDLTTQVRRS